MRGALAHVIRSVERNVFGFEEHLKTQRNWGWDSRLKTGIGVNNIATEFKVNFI